MSGQLFFSFPLDFGAYDFSISLLSSLFPIWFYLIFEQFYIRLQLSTVFLFQFLSFSLTLHFHVIFGHQGRMLWYEEHICTCTTNFSLIFLLHFAIICHRGTPLEGGLNNNNAYLFFNFSGDYTTVICTFYLNFLQFYLYIQSLMLRINNKL